MYDSRTLLLRKLEEMYTQFSGKPQRIIIFPVLAVITTTSSHSDSSCLQVQYHQELRLFGKTGGQSAHHRSKDPF